MDDRALGLAIRRLRQRRGWRQVDLAARSGSSRHRIQDLEAGRLENAGLVALRGATRALDADLSFRLRWRGEDLDRLLNAAHSRLHDSFARLVAGLPGWTEVPEVSFSVYGERGVIDALLWHPGAQALVVVELKSAVVDVQELLGTLDRKHRLGVRVARERGWAPVSVSRWVVVAETRTNRRRVAAHAALLRAALPLDGRAMRPWLRSPDRPVAALTFLTDRPSAGRYGRSAEAGQRRRVRLPHAASVGKGAEPGSSRRDHA